MEYALEKASPVGRIRAGARIANARGIAGVCGCFAVSLDDGRPMLLSCEHVLFGGGAKPGAPVLALEEESKRIGHTRHGRRGLIDHEHRKVHVDCASAELAPAVADSLHLARCAPARVPEREAWVTMQIDGDVTQGIVADTEYQGPARIAGRDFATSGQILVKSQHSGVAFGQRGDSGAALRDADGAVVGLVWGATPTGEALACPIAPVLWLLHVELAR